MMMKYILAASLSVLAFVGVSQARAQAPPLPTGKISVKSASCPSSFLTGMTCTAVTVASCPGAAALTATLGFKAGAGNVGSIALFSGEGGTMITNGPFATDYSADGLDVYQRVWTSQWETVNPKNVLSAACREATLMNYISRIAKQPFRVQGKSGGSASIAYWLSWYGGSTKVSHVTFLSGPVLSDIEQGCEVPDAPAVSVQPTDGADFLEGPQYVTTFVAGVSQFTGHTCRPSTNTSVAEDNSWKSQSIIQPQAVVSFPSLTISAFECNNGLNNSAAQGQIYLQALVTPYTMTAISGCLAAEDVEDGTTPEGVNGQLAIELDTEAH